MEAENMIQFQFTDGSSTDVASGDEAERDTILQNALATANTDAENTFESPVNISVLKAWLEATALRSLQNDAERIADQMLYRPASSPT